MNDLNPLLLNKAYNAHYIHHVKIHLGNYKNKVKPFWNLYMILLICFSFVIIAMTCLRVHLLLLLLDFGFKAFF